MKFHIDPEGVINMLSMLLDTLEKRGISRDDLRREWKLLPNWISYVRTVLSPLPMVLLLIDSDSLELRWWAFGAFLFLAATDGVDGFIARKYNLTSKWGRFIDPIADKFLVAFTILGMLWAFWDHPYGSMLCVLVWLILAREVILTAQIRRAYIGIAPPTWLGKLKTGVQIVMICLWLIPFELLHIGLPAIMALTALITLASWDEYYRRYVVSNEQAADSIAM